MKPFVRNIIIVVLLVAVVVSFHIVRRHATLRGIETNISYAPRHGSTECPMLLIDNRDIDSLIVANFPNIGSTQIRDIPKRAIRQALEASPYVKHADVQLTTGGKLLIDIEPREPILRMFYQDNEFYLSEQGTSMPLSAKHYLHLAVGTSDRQDSELRVRLKTLNLSDTSIHPQPEGLMKIWTLANFLYHHAEYGDIFDQIHLTDKGDLVLIPKLGDYSVLVGDELDLETKFRNLWVFLDQGVRQVGWNVYSQISLKYRGQVICTRRDTK